MYKITEKSLQETVRLLREGAEAINTLERLSGNKFVYLERKKRMQKKADELEDQYGLREFSDPNARNNMLEKRKKEADDNWAGTQSGT